VQEERAPGLRLIYDGHVDCREPGLGGGVHAFRVVRLSPRRHGDGISGARVSLTVTRQPVESGSMKTAVVSTSDLEETAQALVAPSKGICGSRLRFIGTIGDPEVIRKISEGAHVSAGRSLRPTTRVDSARSAGVVSRHKT
jgi:hypothetical protein